MAIRIYIYGYNIKKSYHKNKEKCNDRNLRYYEKNKEKCKEQNSKNSVRRKQELKEEEQTFGKELSDKYGNGSIDLEKGEFIPGPAAE